MATILRRERWRKENEMGKDVNAIGWCWRTSAVLARLSKTSSVPRILGRILRVKELILLGYYRIDQQLFSSSSECRLLSSLLLIFFFSFLFSPLLSSPLKFDASEITPLSPSFVPLLVHFTDCPCTRMDRVSGLLRFNSILYFSIKFRAFRVSRSEK